MVKSFSFFLNFLVAIFIPLNSYLGSNCMYVNKPQEANTSLINDK